MKHFKPGLHLRKYTALACLFTLAGLSVPAHGQSDPELLIGDIILFMNPTCPKHTLPANGQSLSISEYQQLYSIYVDTYGGTNTEFSLPDLRGRTPIGVTTIDGKSTYGQMSGAETVRLTPDNLPTHSHSVNVQSGLQAGVDAATNNFIAGFEATNYYDKPAKASTTLSSNSITSTGAASPEIATVSPSVVINFCVVVEGIYPTRD